MEAEGHETRGQSPEMGGLLRFEGRGIKRVMGNFAGREIASSFPNMFYGLPLRRRRKKNFSNLLLRAGDFAVS